MTTVLLLAFPGFLTLFFYRWFARSRSRAGWDFLVLTGFAGGFTYLLGFVFFKAWNGETLVGILGEVESFLLAPKLQLFPFFLAFCFAPIVAILISIVLYGDSFTKFLVNRLAVRHPPGETDILSGLATAYANTPAVVSLDNQQVYVGFVHNVTTDPDENLKLLVLAYFLSGARMQENNKRVVIYHYSLDFNAENPVRMFLDFRNVVSIAGFDLPTFFKSVEAGYSKIGGEVFDRFLASLVNCGIATKEEVENYF